MSTCPRCQFYDTQGLPVCPACAAGITATVVTTAKVLPPAPGRAELWVPWHCLASDNKRKAPLGAAGRKSHREYAAAMALLVERLGNQWSCCPIAEPCEVRIWLYPPDNRRRDGTNALKCIMDGLVKAGVLVDDNWRIARAVTVRTVAVDREPGARIYLERLQTESEAAA